MDFVKKTNVKNFFRKNGLRVSVNIYTYLDLKIEKLLKDAAIRAVGNQRRTIVEEDL